MHASEWLPGRKVASEAEMVNDEDQSSIHFVEVVEQTTTEANLETTSDASTPAADVDAPMEFFVQK